MREEITQTSGPIPTQRLAVYAKENAEKGIQSYDDIGVGAMVSFTKTRNGQSQWVAYGGTNMNISGMQTKVHAEQFALQQAMMDFEELHDSVEITMNEMVVAVTGDKDYLTCGHCLQITRSACEHIGCNPRKVKYIAANHKGGGVDDFEFREENVDELLSTTYAEW